MSANPLALTFLGRGDWSRRSRRALATSGRRRCRLGGHGSNLLLGYEGRAEGRFWWRRIADHLRLPVIARTSTTQATS